MDLNLKEIFDDKNQLDEKSLEFLLKAIEKNNQNGFDYLEFKLALVRLNNLNIDPAVAIDSVYTTASTVGLTRKKLIDSAGYYLTVLKEEFKQFNSALEKQMESRVHSKEKQKASLENKRAGIEKKINTLTTELNELKNRLDSIDAEADEARKKIEETSDRFGQTLQALTQRIEADIAQFKEELS